MSDREVLALHTIDASDIGVSEADPLSEEVIAGMANLFRAYTMAAMLGCAKDGKVNCMALAGVTRDTLPYLGTILSFVSRTGTPCGFPGESRPPPFFQFPQVVCLFSIEDWGRPFLNQDGKSFPSSAAPTLLPFLIITTRQEEFKDYMPSLLKLNLETLPTKVEERGVFSSGTCGIARTWALRLCLQRQRCFFCSSLLFMLSYGALPR